MEFPLALPSTSGGLFDELDEDIKRLSTLKPVDTTASIRSNATMSSRVSSQSSMVEDTNNMEQQLPELKPLYTAAQFTRLRGFCSAIRASADRVDDLRKELTKNGNLQCLFEQRDLASSIQNRQSLIRIQRTQVEELKRRIAKRRIALCTIMEDRSSRDLEEQQMEITSNTQVDQIGAIEEKLVQKKLHHDILFKLVVKRRRQMIENLISVYKIELRLFPDIEKNGKPACSCSSRDCICGVHLPHAVCLLGHSEQSLAAGFGHVANLLRCLSWILDYPLRYPVLFGSSNSHIVDPKDSKNYPLYGIRTRLERERLDTAVTLLNQNIAQIRVDCGFLTPNHDRTLSCLKDILDWLVQQGSPPLRLPARPYQSVFSPSSVVGPPPPISPSDEVRSSNQRMIHSLDVVLLSIANDKGTLVKKDDTTTSNGTVHKDDLDSSVISANQFDDGLSS